MRANTTISKDTLKAGESIFTPELFCEFCEKIPQYNIDITNKGEIFLEHACSDNKIKRKNYDLIWTQNILLTQKCIYCNNISTKKCLKCEKEICDNCIKEHINIYRETNDEEEKGEYFTKEQLTYFCTNFEKQFFCQVHLILYSLLCPICKINLCKYCVIYHKHINCQSFFEEISEDIKINYKDETNDIFNKLYELAKAFKKCYYSGRTHKYLTLSIIENYHLITQINKYFSENNKNIKNFTIASKYLCDCDETKFLIHSNEEFIENYETLIFYIQTGDISAYHKMNNIYKFYKEKNNLLIKSNLLYKGSFL